MACTQTTRFVPARHPSLIDAYDRFVAEIGDGPRYFGRRRDEGRLVHDALFDAMRQPEVLGIAAVDADRVVALACVGADGGIVVVTVPDWRASGVSTALIDAVAERFAVVLHWCARPRSA